jgi:putative transposase
LVHVTRDDTPVYMARLSSIVIPSVAHYVPQRGGGNDLLPFFFSDDARAAYLALVATGTRCRLCCVLVGA